MQQEFSPAVIMNVESEPIPDERPLTAAEYRLARWMLEHGGAEAQSFLPQLGLALVVSRCPCGCPSIDFVVPGHPRPAGRLRILGNFIYGDESDLNGAFIFECDGLLAGIEVYGLPGDAPKTLPEPEELRPFDAFPAA